MKQYIVLLTLTEKGLQSIKESPGRADAFCAVAERAGIKVNALYWTIGTYDGVLLFDAPDEETAEALMIELNSYGNVRTQTMRALNRESFSRVLTKVG